ncbi:MAG: PKD domain-containing protein [Chitinophagaceae bacterium]
MLNKFIVVWCLLALFFTSCNKQSNSTTPTEVLPTVDTFLTSKWLIFKESMQTVTNGNITVQYIRSCPCNPSHEVYFFTAITPTITDSLNTTYTWTIRKATTYILTGKKVQFKFERAGFDKVELEVKTNGIVVGNVDINVSPLGQHANNKNVAIHADCIDSNRKNFISFYSTDTDPDDGFINARFWDFGDGTSSTDKYLQHEFPKVPYDKTYLVKLFINNSSGCKDSATQEVFIPGYFNNLQCKYSYTKTDACKPSNEIFTFTADATGVPNGASYIWDFKDYVKDIPGQTVTHEFTFPNRYDVTMKIMYNGRQLCSSYDSVFSKGQNVTPIAYFYSSIENETSTSMRRFFNCLSKFDNGTYLSDIFWDYGDGHSEHRPYDDYNSRHTYAKKINETYYNVKMVITASSGCKDSSYTTVMIPKL